MTENNEPELLPCPFCGKEAHFEGRRGKWSVQCFNDGCQCFASTEVRPTMKQAADIWNSRNVGQEIAEAALAVLEGIELAGLDSPDKWPHDPEMVDRLRDACGFVRRWSSQPEQE